MLSRSRGTVVAVGLLLALAPALAAQQAPAPAPSTPARLGGYLQTRVTYQNQVGMTATINRARLQGTGTIATGFSYKVQGEFRTGNAGRNASVSLTDAFIRYSHQALSVQVGQFKTPFTWEYLTSIADLETLDRSSVVDSLAPKRDIGIMGDYQAGKYLLFSAGVFNGEGVNVTTNRDSTVLGVARVAIKPVPKVTIGINAARWFGDSLRYGADISWQDQQFVARGEYVGGARDSLDIKDDWGWYVLAGFKPVPAVQLVAKYEDFRREAISPQFRNRAYSIGINGWPVIPSVRLSMFYLSRKVGDPGVRKGLLQTQMQVKF
jgi:phosphate-selective porin O/P